MLEFTQHAYSLLTRILFLVFLAFFALSTGLTDLHSNACTDEQSTRNRKLFNFRKFGNASGLEQCVDFCCRDDICELAIFSRGFHCYGVSCDEPELCHKILDRLLMDDERQLQRSTRNIGTRDFIRHTSQVANPRCPKRFVPSFHVLLLGTSSPREFRKLRPHSDVVGSGQCSTQCCKSRDCLLSFIEDEECYGVTGAKAKTNGTNAIQEPRIGLQVAIIDRNKEVSRSLDDEDEDPDDLGSDDSDVKQEVATRAQTKQQHPSPKVQEKMQTTPSNKMSLITNSPKTATKTNGGNVSKNRSFKIAPTKGSFQRPKHRIINLHAVHPSIGEDKISSKVSTKRRIIRPNIKQLSPTKGHSSHVTSAVTQNRTINTKLILKPADRNLSSVAKPFKTASPSKTKYRAKVTQTIKNEKTADTRNGTQSVSTEGYSKIKHLAQTKKTVTLRKSSSANSGATKTPKENQGNSFKSSVAKTKWHIPGFMEGFSEGSASGDEHWSGENINLGREHRVFSGEDLDLSGNDKYLSIEHNGFSGEYSDLSGDDEELSGVDMAFVREHNAFSGDNKDLRWDDTDSSGNDKDLMDSNDVLSGDNKDFLEENDVKKITHRVMQDKTYVGEDREGHTRRKIDLVKDLDELGSDEEDSDQNNKEQSKLASRKVSNLPKHLTSGVLKKSKIGGYGKMKSKRVNFKPKQQPDKETKQASNVSSRRISRPLRGKNRLKNGANVKTRPLLSGLAKHSVIVSSVGAKRLKGNLNDQNGRLRKVAHDVKANGIRLNSELLTKKSSESNKQLKSRKEGRIKTRDDNKRQRMIKSAVRITTHAKLSGIKNSSDRSIKPKGKHRGTETIQSLSSRTESQGQISTKYRQVTNSAKSKITGASSTRKTLKVISSSQKSKTSRNATGTVYKHGTVPFPERKIESAKDAVRSQKHLTSKDELLKSGSSLRNSKVIGDNTKEKHRKSLVSEKIQDSHNLQSKERKLQPDHKNLIMSGSYRTRSEKEGERSVKNSNSTLEDTEDLMHYADRKVSLKHKPSVNRHVQRYLPTKKRSTFVKTTSRQQDVTILKESQRNYKTNRTETARANRRHVHPKARDLQKERKSRYTNPTTSKHPTTAALNKRKHDNLGGAKSLITTPRSHSHHALAFLSTDKPDDASSNENVSLPSNPTLSSSPPLIKKETHSPARIHTSSNNALLSLKQRSNINTSDTKARFLAHFHQANSSGSDGVEFSVKSRGKHHRSKGKHEKAIDVEDLGDAEFDIMMSNDIPHKDLPRKEKGEKRHHKHKGKGEKKQHDTKDDVRKKKKRKDTSHEKDEEDYIKVSEKSSAEGHSSRFYRDKSEEIKKSTTTKHHRLHHHHHHHYHHEDDADNKNQEDQKENDKESHQHYHKHKKSTNYEHKDSDSKTRHHNAQKKHSHLVTKIENDDRDDNRNSVDSIHVKHHHKKVETDDSREDDSKNDGRKEHRHHHKHKKHYDDNRWEGKIIPGKVKLTYEEDSSKKRHHKHHAREDDENSEMKKEHHGRKHPLKEHETHSDSDEETNDQIKKHHRHSKEKTARDHEHEDEDYEDNEEHKEYRENDEAKHKFKHRHKEEEKERAEKRTDVNYEVVKKDRHRLVHKEANAEDDSESSKRKHDNDDDNDDDDDNDEKHNSEEDEASASGDNGNSENSSHNRVVLGEDSESNDDDEDKHAEERHKSQNRHRHGNEHRDNERGDAGHDAEDDYSTSHEEDHQPAFHDRHEQERHWESKHKHFEPNEESITDDDNDNNDDDNSNFKNSRRNFRKSFIYHRKRKKQRRLRQHHENERGREEEYNKDSQEDEFHVHKQHPDDIYKHHHHYRHHDGDDNEKTEKYEDRYEPKEAHGEDSFKHDEGGYESNEHNEEEMRDYEKQREESKKFRFHDQTKHRKPNVEFEEHNDKRFHHKKEHHHGGYIPREGNHDERKFKGDFHDWNSPDSSHRQEQDQYKNSFRENKRPADDDEDHRAYYNEGRKYVPRHREKSHWKHRHFHEDEEQDLEGTGGSFDSSAWLRDENSEDDHYYGGEGNQEYHRKKHRKHKHRKHRQSYEYWAYREQNPYYYDYNYHKSRPPYGYYRPQPTVHPPPGWQKYHYGSYSRWKPKPKSWYPNKEHWDGKPPWRSFEEKKPTLGYQWHTFYSNRGVTNQPKPTPYPVEPSHAWPPTNPRWQQPDQSQRKFGGDTWSPGHGLGPEKQYNDWSKTRPSTPLNQGKGDYWPSAGLQPSRNLGSSMPDRQQQLQGVKSKYVPPTQPHTNGLVSQTRFRPTVRRQYQVPPPSQVSSPTNISQIKSIMDKLNTPPSAVGGRQAGRAPTVNLVPAQNTANNKTGLLRKNLTSGDQIQDRNRLNGFFNEENGGKKKSEIVKPTNVSHGVQAAKNSSASANTSHHVQQSLPSITSTPAKPLHSTQVANMTTTTNTTPTQTTSSHTNKPTKPAQNSSTTAMPTHTTAVHETPAGPNFGDVSQSDDSSETGKKHRKHRAPVCIAGKITDDVTLLRGKRAGNFTNIGDVGDFEMCIKRCCQHQKCDLAFKSAETCFLVNCFSKESCQTSPSLDDIFSPRMCFVTRHLKDDEKGTPGQDRDDEWNDKVSPSGIREVCDVEKALGLLWKKTIAGRYSAHPCPRGAKGFVKRRCEADSRWLPPDFSECVSKDYQTLFDKSKKLATGADPSPLIRELSQLTTQNIDNSLIFGGDLDRATDIMAAIVQHNGQTELIDMTREDVENFVRASSNLLDMTNLQEWFNIQKNKPGTADVLRSMEMFALQAAMRLPREDMAEPLITNNIIIKMDRKSPGDGGLTFPDFSNSKISRWDARHDVIALPSSVFDRGEVSTASISFKSLPYLLPDSNVSTGLGPNSKVISTVLHPHPQEKITPPVTVVLSHIKRRRGNPKCVFWDYTLNPHRGGAWSSRGCWLAFSNHSHSICQCSHLSNFAVLMDLSSDEVSQKEQKRERTMALMWIGIPVLIVGVIGGLYMSFSWNRKSGMPSTVTRPSAALNEKTGLLGQRVVTSQIREEFPASPTRDLYRALSPGYSPTGDLEWQDEFDFEMESGDQGFKQMLLPKLQMLQKQLISEFYDGDNMETKKKKLLESKIKQKSQITAERPVQSDTAESVHNQALQLKPRIPVQSPVQCDAVESVHKQKIQANPQATPNSSVQCEAVRTVNRQRTQTKSQIAAERPVKSQTLRIARRQMKTSSGRKLRVRFADEKPPGRNLTDEDKERFKRLQRMERRVFFQHLSRWTANSHLNLSD